MLKQIETSKSVNRGVGASNVTGGVVSQSRATTTNSEIPTVYWEGRNVTPQSLTKIVRIEEKQNGIEGGRKLQDRENGALFPSCKVKLPMTRSSINVQEEEITPMNSSNNKQGGTGTTTNKEDTISAHLNASIGPTTFILAETETMTLLNLRSSVVAKDSRLCDAVMLQGREYEKLKALKLGSDRYSSRSTQTPIIIQKNKEVMVMAVNKKDVACESSTWDMTTELSKCLEDEAFSQSTVASDGHQAGSCCVHIYNKFHRHLSLKQSDDRIAMALTDIPGCFLDVSGTYSPPPIPQHSGDTRGTTKRSSYYPNIGGGSRKGSTISRSHWGGQSNTSLTRSGRKSVAAASDNNNTSFSTATSCPRGVTAISAASAPLSAVRSPNRNELSLEEVEKRLFEKKTRSIMESSELLSALKIVERCIASHSFLEKQLLYCYSPLLGGSTTALRGVGGIVSDAARNVFTSKRKMQVKVEDGKPKQSSSVLDPVELSTTSDACNRVGRRGRLSLEKLWVHPYPFCSQQSSTRSMCVTSLSFSLECSGSEGVIAAGYSISALRNGIGFAGAMKEGGKVLFWSLRNPNQPEGIIHTPSGVLSLGFNPEQPQLLAIGMYNGDVAVYDLSCCDDTSVLIADSSTSSGKHMDPVWQVKWVKSESGEIVLVSVSTDGRVVKWSLKKGLSYNPMMLLKCVGDAKGILSRQAGGISIDFLPFDSSRYIVSTEDGPIHQCSISYSEQFLKTYGGSSGDYGSDGGHNGPVYRVQCSPLLENQFVSCGADWIVKVRVVSHSQENNTAITNPIFMPLRINQHPKYNQ